MYLNLKTVGHCPALNHKMMFVDAGLGTNESLKALRNVHQLNDRTQKKKYQSHLSTERSTSYSDCMSGPIKLNCSYYGPKDISYTTHTCRGCCEVYNTVT